MTLFYFRDFFLSVWQNKSVKLIKYVTCQNLMKNCQFLVKVTCIKVCNLTIKKFWYWHFHKIITFIQWSQKLTVWQISFCQFDTDSKKVSNWKKCYVTFFAVTALYHYLSFWQFKNVSLEICSSVTFELVIWMCHYGLLYFLAFIHWIRDAVWLGSPSKSRHEPKIDYIFQDIESGNF